MNLKNKNQILKPKIEIQKLIQNRNWDIELRVFKIYFRFSNFDFNILVYYNAFQRTLLFVTF